MKQREQSMNTLQQHKNNNSNNQSNCRRDIAIRLPDCFRRKCHSQPRKNTSKMCGDQTTAKSASYNFRPKWTARKDGIKKEVGNSETAVTAKDEEDNSTSSLSDDDVSTDDDEAAPSTSVHSNDNKNEVMKREGGGKLYANFFWHY